MTTVTAVSYTPSTNVFDSENLQAMASGMLGQHNSSLFYFTNSFFFMEGHGANIEYSDGHPSSGTLTSMELQLGINAGVSFMDWSSFNVPIDTLWSTFSTGNVAAFNNLFFSGNDTFNMQESNGWDDLAGGPGDDT